MTQVKKRSRLITVDGVAYRWRVRRRGPVSFAIEQADRRGTVLVATARTGWATPGTPAAVPDMLAAVIRRARAAGWHPERPGQTFLLTVEPELRAR